jgi:hypothetical protein
MSKESVPPDMMGTLTRFDSGVLAVTATTNVATVPVYVSKIILLPFATGTGPTITIQDAAGTPNKYVNALAAPTTGTPTIIDFAPAVKFVGGVTAVAGGTGPSVPIQIVGWFGV